MHPDSARPPLGGHACGQSDVGYYREPALSGRAFGVLPPVGLLLARRAALGGGAGSSLVAVAAVVAPVWLHAGGEREGLASLGVATEELQAATQAELGVVVRRVAV